MGLFTQVAWFLGDELLGQGIPLVNITAVARRIKQQWGAAQPALVYTNGELSNFLTAEGLPATATEPCANSLRCAAGIGLPGKWQIFPGPSVEIADGMELPLTNDDCSIENCRSLCN